MRGLKGWILAIVAGVYLAAVTVLVIMNLGNRIANVSVYWKTVNDLPLGVSMLVAMAMGLVVWWAIKWLIHGVKLIRASRKAAHIKQLQDDEKKRLKEAAHAGQPPKSV